MPKTWQLVLVGGPFDGLTFSIPDEHATPGRSYEVSRDSVKVIYVENKREDTHPGYLTPVIDDKGQAWTTGKTTARPQAVG